MAYAEDALSAEVESAAIRRRDRKPELVSLEKEAVIGENKSGLVEIRDSARANSSVEKLVGDENSDRMIIYQSVAKKNQVTLAEIQKMYAKRLIEDAPAGAPVETSNGWKIK